MKKNIVAFEQTNMSGNQDFPEECGFLGARSRVLTSAEKDHAESLFSLFEKHLVGTRANSNSTVKLAMGAIRGFYKYLGLPPWAWCEEDLSDFLYHKVAVDEIGLGRQSTYITYLRAFQNYILDSRGLCNEIHQLFGVQPQRFISNENAIPIKRKNHERKKLVTPLTSEMTFAIIQEFDARIRQAGLIGSKSLKTLKRDKTICMVILLSGIRIHEVLDLKVNSFQADAQRANFGHYALVTIFGKGRKTRVVRFYNPMIKPLMDWYLDTVRPGFLNAKTIDPNLLFLSERGGRLCEEQIRKTLEVVRSGAGIPFGVKPHLLRHTYATEMAAIIGPEALQHQLGHTHLSTTLGTYYHQDPERVGNEVNLGVEKLTKAIDDLIEGL
jgi:integrase